jgi:hypothetical protein
MMAGAICSYSWVTCLLSQEASKFFYTTNVVFHRIGGVAEHPATTQIKIFETESQAVHGGKLEAD